MSGFVSRIGVFCALIVLGAVYAHAHTIPTNVFISRDDLIKVGVGDDLLEALRTPAEIAPIDLAEYGYDLPDVHIEVFSVFLDEEFRGVIVSDGRLDDEDLDELSRTAMTTELLDSEEVSADSAGDGDSDDQSFIVWALERIQNSPLKFIIKPLKRPLVEILKDQLRKLCESDARPMTATISVEAGVPGAKVQLSGTYNMDETCAKLFGL